MRIWMVENVESQAPWQPNEKDIIVGRSVWLGQPEFPLAHLRPVAEAAIRGELDAVVLRTPHGLEGTELEKLFLAYGVVVRSVSS